MKILSSFLLLVILARVNLTAMEPNPEVTEKNIVLFRGSDSDDLIAVPVKIANHSPRLGYLLALGRRFSPQGVISYGLPINSSTLHVIVDCLKIIDSKDDVENLLCDYVHNFMIQSTEQEQKNLFSAASRLKIQPLCTSFGRVNDRVNKERLDQIKQKLDSDLQEAKASFEKIENKESSAIIFDVDDTALNRAQQRLCVIKINGVSMSAFYYSALSQVHAFYKDVITLGFKIFFLTARAQSHYDTTVHNLIGEGYDIFEKIICIPDEIRLQTCEQAEGDLKIWGGLIAQWKESERNKIAEKFTIVGTIDDTQENLQGENVGHPILIPKFF